ncbi:four-carbon acid sugar kinase family protein [Alsobacter sp. SYSU BS001988]
MTGGVRRRPRLGWYGDDFTGATDTLSTLAEHGLRALLFLGSPTPERLAGAGRLDAVGVAGASRALAPDAMAAELGPVGRFFADLGVSVLHYKCCSTFDSAPDVGSIGAAVATLRNAAPNAFVPIVGGQPNLSRYCLFATLFAAAGAGGEVVRIDRHPTMRAHPVTPMGEADLRLHLAKQGLAGVASLDYRAYEAGDPGRALDDVLRAGPPAVLMDVSRADDLPVIGRLIWAHALRSPLLAVGASSVAQALAAAWPDGALSPRVRAAAPASSGPVFLMAGSLSPVTRAQVEAAASFERIDVDAARLVDDAVLAQSVRADAVKSLRQGRNVMVVTDRPDGAPQRAAEVAQATAELVRLVVDEAPIGRLAIAGGDTSSIAVRKLDFWGLSHEARVAGGVSLCRGRSDDPRLDGLDIVLKGGQMGPPDLFERVAHGSDAA